jgi:hypothetical protein
LYDKKVRIELGGGKTGPNQRNGTVENVKRGTRAGKKDEKEHQRKGRCFKVLELRKNVNKREYYRQQTENKADNVQIAVMKRVIRVKVKVKRPLEVEQQNGAMQRVKDPNGNFCALRPVLILESKVIHEKKDVKVRQNLKQVVQNQGNVQYTGRRYGDGIVKQEKHKIRRHCGEGSNEKRKEEPALIAVSIVLMYIINNDKNDQYG